MKNILIIEDDVFLGDVLIEKLKQEGYNPTLSRDGAEGFQKIKELKPDLILLDIILPNMNGYEILEAKQKDSEISLVPVIIISNSGQPVEINRALALGVKDYIVKAQFDPAEVITKVRNFLNKDGDETKASSPTSNPGSTGSIEGRKIMWVEDDNFLSEIVAHKITTEKGVLLHAKDGEGALSILETEKPDVILLDILLPSMNGFEILEKIKNNPKTKDIPVILLSNLGQDSDIEKGKALGAEIFLTKASLTLDEIIEQVNKVLKKKEAQ